ncbi:MAG: class II aldolase/adducin family protein [Gammaproteobacteria bacterium]|nr:class II aldolase/adducin family protein [Gammaproteobacteria bacterium]
MSEPDPFREPYNPPEFSAEEWQARLDLALCYRLVNYYGWTAQVYNHISLRIPGTDHLLINGFGFMYNEIKASNLVKIDIDGNVIDGNPYPVNKAGYYIHSAIHQARPDLHCVLHTHDIDCQAVASIEGGFIPLTQESCQFYERVGYHEYEGIVLDPGEKKRLVAALGNTNHTLLLHNHGVITAGSTAVWAFDRMYQIVRACQVQLRAMATGKPVKRIPEAVMISTREQFEGGAAQGGAVVRHPAWPAYIRLMDSLAPDWRT